MSDSQAFRKGIEYFSEIMCVYMVLAAISVYKTYEKKQDKKEHKLWLDNMQ